MTINFHIKKNDLLKCWNLLKSSLQIWITSQWFIIWGFPSGMARTNWFSAYPCINKVFTPDDPRNYLRSICSLPLPLQVKNRITLFPFSDILKLFFLGDIFLTFLDLTFPRQIHFLVFERVPTKTKNRVSLWAIRFREKSSLVLGPTF